MNAVSRDVTPPKWGPAFLRFNARAYRLEMAVFTLALFVVLFYWRLLVVGDLNPLLVVFWFLWPDVAAFIPIGLAMRGTKRWPAWGPGLYNVTHTFLVWLPVILIWSVVAGGIEWPLLGWAGHITADRSVGYYLRARSP